MLCAPSLGGESFGMVLTEAFAAGTPVVASDIAGYRDVVRDGVDGVLVPAATPARSPRRCATSAEEPARRARMARAAAEDVKRFAWPRVADEVMDGLQGRDRHARLAASALGVPPCGSGCARPTSSRTCPPGGCRAWSRRPQLRRRAGAFALLRRVGLAAISLGGAVLAAAGAAADRPGQHRHRAAALQPRMRPARTRADVRVDGAPRVLAGTRSCNAALPTRASRLSDAMQGTFIGVLMSSTLPARLGEPSRALVVARRTGRPRETCRSCSGRSSPRRC